ncbi:hypothetical protein KJ656_01310 [bacterium]|nr:hypothetical protein [bacterium]
MEITIDKKTRIISEELNWIVQFKRTKPMKLKGIEKPYEWENWGYFQSLRAAVQRLIEHKVRMIPFSDVERVLERISEIQKEMLEVLRPYDLEVVSNLNKTVEGVKQAAHSTKCL